MRIVLDPDVLVAGLRSKAGASRVLIEWALLGEVEIALSVSLVLAYEDLLLRPEGTPVPGLTRNDMRSVLDALCSVGVQTGIDFRWRPILSGALDDVVLEAALNGGAGAIITFRPGDFEAARPLGVRVEEPPQMLDWLRSMECDL